MNLKEFGSLQLRVLEMLWRRERASAGDLWEDWPGEPRPAYTTVLSALQKLYKRKLVRRRKQGRSHTYTPCINRESFQQRYVAEVRRKVFGGSAAAIVAALFDDEEISSAELTKIQRLLARKKKQS